MNLVIQPTKWAHQAHKTGRWAIYDAEMSLLAYTDVWAFVSVLLDAGATFLQLGVPVSMPELPV